MELALYAVFSDADAWALLAVVIKALTYSASFFTGGGVVFLLLFDAHLVEAERRTIRHVVAWGALLVVIASILRVTVMNGLLGGSWADMFDVDMTRMVLQSREGWATGLRLAGAGLVWVMLRGSSVRVKNHVTIVGAALVVLSFVWVGHAGEVQGYGLAPLALLSLHLLAVAYWLGALWPLHLVARGDDVSRIAALMRGFGAIAALIVVVLIVAGVLLLASLLGAADELWTTGYGQMFAFKLGTVIVLLSFAALNKLHLTPRLLQGDVTALGALRRSIRIEMALAGLILLTTAAFTTLVGPASLA